MHSRHRWLVHRDVAGTVDLLLRGQPTHPQARELGSDGRLLLRDDGPVRPAPPPAWTTAPTLRRSGPAPMAVVPLPAPAAPRPAAASAASALPALRVFGVGLATQQLEEAVRRRQLPVQVVEEPEQADAVLSVRGQLGRDPELRRQARDLGLPILVIKSDTPHQLQRAMERLLERRQGAGGDGDGEELVGVGAARPDDAHGALEECRLAVEQVVLPQGRPVELLPRNEVVRALQAELVHHYGLRSAVFGRGRQQRLRVFPA